jgi:alginate O-acetyltransferase complex protein AlgI
VLFNSPEFLFGFLPIVLLGFFVGARFGQRAALSWLTLASVLFYGWWNAAWVPLILASIVFNFFAGRELHSHRAGLAGGPPRHVSAKALLIAAVAANLATLGYFKYAGFIVGNVADLSGHALQWQAPELPLGISFFTFTQIAFLVDVYQRKAADFSPVRYGLFVTYFPHLIAGPILHHREMMPQFERADIFRFDPSRLADGGVIFLLGLFKKVVLADEFGRNAAPAFAAAGTHALSLFESWGAALAYTFQIYFDFSGYCDMAIGLALMIGVQLPLNFHSPYKARNIAEFWRRWHMTLSRFLRDYLYIPLGGNRCGATRRMANLMLTMLLGGLWHGAGWTFVIWGGLHGAYLVVHRGWQLLPWPDSPGRAAVAINPLLSFGSWALTFLCVVVAWVFFRAADLPTALSMLRAMTGANGAYLPEQLIALIPWLGHFATGAGKVAYLGDGTVMGSVSLLCMLALGFGITLCAPSMLDLTPRLRYLLVVPCAALALQRVLFGTPSEFLYFQF